MRKRDLDEIIALAERLVSLAGRLVLLCIGAANAAGPLIHHSQPAPISALALVAAVYRRR